MWRADSQSLCNHSWLAKIEHNKTAGDVSFFRLPGIYLSTPFIPTSFRYFVVTACSLEFAEDNTCGFQSPDGTTVAEEASRDNLFEIVTPETGVKECKP